MHERVQTYAISAATTAGQSKPVQQPVRGSTDASGRQTFLPYVYCNRNSALKYLASISFVGQTSQTHEQTSGRNT